MIDWLKVSKEDFQRAKEDMRNSRELGKKDVIPKYIIDKYDEAEPQSGKREGVYDYTETRDEGNGIADYSGYDYAAEKQAMRREQAAKWTAEKFAPYTNAAQYERKNRPTGAEAARRNESVRANLPIYEDVNDALIDAANLMNRLTQESNKETCCNLYSMMNETGDRVYFTGTKYTGGHSNVVGHYMTTLPNEASAVIMNNLGKGIRYEGYVHTHPYCTVHGEKEYSLGDSVTAKLSGKAYLSTPRGEVYLLQGEDSKPFMDEEFNTNKAILIADGAYSGAIADGEQTTQNDINVRKMQKARQEVRKRIQDRYNKWIASERRNDWSGK